MITIHTPRLLLRPFCDTDIEPYAAMCGDPEVMRYLGDRAVLSKEDAWRQMAMLVGHWSLRGFGSWAVEERATGNFVGRVGLHYPDGWPDREVNWAFARQYWGKDFGFEAAQAALALPSTRFTGSGPRVLSIQRISVRFASRNAWVSDSRRTLRYGAFASGSTRLTGWYGVLFNRPLKPTA